MDRRGSGILLHITSLPSAFGIGDLGPGAYEFADFLSNTGQIYWQILPINPTDQEHGNSPYHSYSAFAGNPMLISPEMLVRDGLLFAEDLEPLPGFSRERIDFRSVISYKETLFHLAYERFKKRGSSLEYEEYRSKNAHWLDDFALFLALKSRFPGQIWTQWEDEIRDRRPEAMQSVRKELHEAVDKNSFLQYLFSRQWMALKNYCNEKGIKIIGDIPIYVVHDSIDVWLHPELFNLDDEKRPITVAGVPPDYFSDTGQLWGNPVYRWDLLKEQGYEWWAQRIRHNLELFDLTRLDHFRGFMAYWEIPSSEENAINGRWVEAPAWDFFNNMSNRFSCLPIIAEDLGVITPDVVKIRRHFKFPGMKILLFAFGHDLPTNPYAPHNLEQNCVLFTGTHDNNTTRGWFKRETTPEDRKRIFRYLGREVSEEEISWELIRLAMMSVADTVIFPMQDLLSMGEEARMNRPSTTEGNWVWRLMPEQLAHPLAHRLKEMTEIYGRT